MVPENGSFTYISHDTLLTTDLTVPVGTTHMVLGSGNSSDVYGILAVRFDGTTLNKILVPLGQFIRITNIVGGTTDLLTSTLLPVSSVTSATYYKWES
jgi:hypothetical protein